MASEVEKERRREAAMLRRSSYFPAANLRQFEGTELAPPGPGTYYNPDRYRGFGGNIGRLQRSLAKQYQQDLEFNVMANPNVARDVEARRIGGQYRGGSKFGKPGYTTIQLPGGGTATVPNREAKGILANVSGTSVFDPEKIRAEGYAKGYGSTQTPQVIEGAGGRYLSRGGVMTPIENLTSPTDKISYPATFGENLRTSGLLGRALYGLGTLGYNAYQALSRGMSGAPSDYARTQFSQPGFQPPPYTYSSAVNDQPRRYFDF